MAGDLQSYAELHRRKDYEIFPFAVEGIVAKRWLLQWESGFFTGFGGGLCS